MTDKSLAELLWDSLDALADLEKTRKCAICHGENELTLLMYLYKEKCYAGYFCPRCADAMKHLEAIDVISGGKRWDG
jgi:hypothetical protein